MNTGAQAEKLAELYLLSHGLTLLDRNFRCKGGEIDLVMDHQGSTVFVEVRLRSNQQFANPLESVTLAKQRKLSIAAQHFLSAHPVRAQTPCRFDVVAFRLLDKQPEWIQAAFC